MKFIDGTAKDGKHYWLTPPELLEELDKEFQFDFDPCPYPRPDDLDGLECEWGQSNYVNPPFGGYMDKDKKKGPTAWMRKAIAEHKKGKKVVVVYPIDRWIILMLEAGAEVRNLGNVKFHSTEDGQPGPGTARPVAMFILDPK